MGTHAGTGRHILIVDDQAELRQLLSIALGRRGYVVAAAEDAREALQTIAERFEHRREDGARLVALDLLVVDIMMPEVSGLDLLHVLGRTYAAPLPPAMIMSALHDEARVRESLALGVVDYVPKPVEMEVFLHRLRSVFEDPGEPLFHWASLPKHPPVQIGEHTGVGVAISEGGILVELGAGPQPELQAVLHVASPCLAQVGLVRPLHGRVVRITRRGGQAIVELSFVGVPSQGLHGLRRYCLSH